MITLPHDAYKLDLLQWVLSLNVSESDKAEYELLYKVCGCYLWNGDHDYSIHKITITEEQKSLILERDYIHAEDKEVRARFQDVALRCGMYHKERRCLMRECSDLYLELYEELGDYPFLIRSVLVREIRFLYDEVYGQRLVNIISTHKPNPTWIKVIADRLKINYGLKSFVVQSILDTYATMEALADFDWRSKYYELLFTMGQIEEKEYFFRQAINHENEGDYQISIEEPNTVYPNPHVVYQNAFNEIDKIAKSHPEDWKRIHDKCVRERKRFVEMLSIAGIQTRYDVPNEIKEKIHREITQTLKFDNAQAVLFEILESPYFPAIPSFVQNVRSKMSNDSSIMAMCSYSEQLDKNGNTIGISREDYGFKVSVHRYLRSIFLYYLWTMVDQFHLHRLKLEEETVYDLLRTRQSTYIDEQRLLFWSKGIAAIFNGEEIMGSYLLIPQIEYLIRALAELKIGDQTKLSKEIQNESTFGPVFHDLKPHIEDCLYDEINYFLLDGIDLNLRNTMMHGLAEPMIVLRHSVYVLYLALNLYFYEDRFLFRETDISNKVF